MTVHSLCVEPDPSAAEATPDYLTGSLRFVPQWRRDEINRTPETSSQTLPW